MTTEKMPDVIWAYNDGYTVEITCPPTEHDIFPHAKYLRAEPVEDLLKQVRDALKTCSAFEDKEERNRKKTITTIDKFLGEK